MANFTIVVSAAATYCIKSMIDLQLVVDSFGWSNGAGQLHGDNRRRGCWNTRERSWGLGALQGRETRSIACGRQVRCTQHLPTQLF